ncbi:MAG TPA: 4-(cytidine 5'-diphospho)-2-C-methyl-D-erythritol kinase [Acidobacteriaceae bacterium]|jgi:4-diphosphocytidyl-2-C-methyl-D-erythritol kinase|nr:4-(cytidine 5'-diphospho)-2-C-methyl-D-erythritol kinase [Acidobacteriaceae bacterium]
MPTRVRSFSKINLGLAVGPARADGYHALATVYQTLALHDIVTVSVERASTTAIHLSANHPGVPRTETGDADRNTAYRIIDTALKRLNLTVQVSINVDIDKRLPVQGGLGAGSANAAAALIGLERELGRMGLEHELGLALPRPARLALAAEIGSDVPLFLLGGTVLGLGRGEQVVPLPDLPPTPCVVAVPEVGVSTAAAFRDLDTLAALDAQNPRPETSSGTSKTPLTNYTVTSKIDLLSCGVASAWTLTGVDLTRFPSPPSPSGIASKLRQDNDLQAPGNQDRRSDLAENLLLALVRTGIENDFEQVVFQHHPSLRSTKRDLVGSGSNQALYAALSGSGSALFGLYRSTADALAAQQRVQASGMQALLTETLPRAEYWHTMLDASSSEMRS